MKTGAFCAAKSYLNYIHGIIGESQGRRLDNISQYVYGDLSRIVKTVDNQNFEGAAISLKVKKDLSLEMLAEVMSLPGYSQKPYDPYEPMDLDSAEAGYGDQEIDLSLEDVVSAWRNKAVDFWKQEREGELGVNK